MFGFKPMQLLFLFLLTPLSAWTQYEGEINSSSLFLSGSETSPSEAGESGTQGDSDAVQTVDFVDLQKYLGEWYEIASVPASFQNKCLGSTKARYQMAEKNRISVINSCETSKGLEESEGRAKVVDSTTQAKLKVTFVNLGDWVFLFGGDYWISGLGPQYEYAVITHPSRKYGWILSRTPELSKKFLRDAAAVLLKNGYSLCNFKVTPQGNERIPLEKRQELCQFL